MHTLFMSSPLQRVARAGSTLSPHHQSSMRVGQLIINSITYSKNILYIDSLGIDR